MIVLANKTYFKAYALAQAIQDQLPSKFSATLFFFSVFNPLSLLRPVLFAIDDGDEVVLMLRRALALAASPSRLNDQAEWNNLFSSNVLLDNPNVRTVLSSELAGGSFFLF